MKTARKAEIELLVRLADPLFAGAELRVETATTTAGPEIKRFGSSDALIKVPVQHEVWVCDDPEDGCMDEAAEATGAARFIAASHVIVKELLAELEQQPITKNCRMQE